MKESREAGTTRLFFAAQASKACARRESRLEIQLRVRPAGADNLGRTALDHRTRRYQGDTLGRLKSIPIRERRAPSRLHHAVAGGQGPRLSERALAGSVPTIGARSGPVQGQGLPVGHQAGFATRYSDAGSARAAIDGFQTTALLTVS